MDLNQVLHEKGISFSLEKINTIQQGLYNSNFFHLRDLALNAEDISPIMDIILKANSQRQTKSISFSFNPLIGDEGAIIIANKIPKTVTEIGLVKCEIGDEGGKELLKKIKQMPDLRMLCIEQNKFSNKLKTEFNQFRKNNPHILVIV